MRVLHVMPSFYPAHFYGGPITTVRALCAALAELGCEIKVVTTDANGLSRLNVDNSTEIPLDSYRVRYFRRWGSGSVSPSLLRSLSQYIKWADVVHLTAVYSFPTIPTLLLCRLHEKRVVWSPRGALKQWAGSPKLTIKHVWDGLCRAVMSTDAVLHVTTEQEKVESLVRLPGISTAVIPNGVSIPPTLDRTPGGGCLRLLFLGRIHPIKGLGNLLQACRALPVDCSWHLTVAGMGEVRHVLRLRESIQACGFADRISMIGHVTGAEREDAFGNSDLLILPSYTENFGQVVAEALVRGVPVIASKGTPWQELEVKGCGLWVENDPDSLASAILRARDMPLSEMGKRGRKWMEAEFSWEARAQDMYHVYGSVEQMTGTRLDVDDAAGFQADADWDAGGGGGGSVRGFRDHGETERGNGRSHVRGA